MKNGPQRETYFTRPPDAPRNAHVPRLAWLAQHLMTLSDAVAMRALHRLPFEEMVDRETGEVTGLLFKNARLVLIEHQSRHFMPTAIDGQPGSAMPLRTLAHCFERMQSRGLVRRYGSQARHSPHGTHWFVPRFTEVKKALKTDPDILTEGPNNGHFWVIGKSRRAVTRAEGVRWGLIHAEQAEQMISSHAKLDHDYQEPATRSKPKPTAAEALGDDIAKVLAGIHACRIPAEEKHAVRLLELARAAAPRIPADAIAGKLIPQLVDQRIRDIRAMRDEASRRQPVRVEDLIKGVGGVAALWASEQRRAEQATRAG